MELEIPDPKKISSKPTISIQEKRSIKQEILDNAKSNMVAQGLSPKLETCCFVSISSIVPERLADPFWEAISQNAPFSWGDNNRSLICAYDLLRHIDQIEDSIDLDPEELAIITKELASLEDTYIDLEN